MAEEEVAAFVVNSGSGMHSAGLLVKMHLAFSTNAARMACTRSEVCTVDASVAVSLRNSDIFPTNPLNLQSCSAVGRLR